jgi:hypothetical protein
MIWPTNSPANLDRVIELERADAAKFALEHAARKLEEQQYESEAYQKAMKTAAALVRSLKP